MATGTSSRDFAVHLACTSTSCCVADGLCLPFDFLKTRMQLQNELLPSSAPRLGPLSMAARILRAEGAAAFYAGFPAAMLPQPPEGGRPLAETEVEEVLDRIASLKQVLGS